jgi:hypothetical protein
MSTMEGYFSPTTRLCDLFRAQDADDSYYDESDDDDSMCGSRNCNDTAAFTEVELTGAWQEHLTTTTTTRCACASFLSAIGSNVVWMAADVFVTTGACTFNQDHCLKIGYSRILGMQVLDADAQPSVFGIRSR